MVFGDCRTFLACLKDTEKNLKSQGFLKKVLVFFNLPPVVRSIGLGPARGGFREGRRRGYRPQYISDVPPLLRCFHQLRKEYPSLGRPGNGRVHLGFRSTLRSSLFEKVPQFREGGEMKEIVTQITSENIWLLPVFHWGIMDVDTIIPMLWAVRTDSEKGFEAPREK